MSDPTRPKGRLDKWLWQARFFKTRGLAASQVTGGHVRVNGTKVAKAAYAISPGDVLTFTQANRVRVVEILALATRRGPAPEAQALYDDQSPPPDPKPPVEQRVGGRPTGKDRRKMDALRPPTLE